jgi:predicted GIY-YIG superfamily endonuclease
MTIKKGGGFLYLLDMKDLIKHILREFTINEQKKWDKETVLNLAQQYSKMNDFKKNHSQAYQAALRYGWIDEIREFMIPAYQTWDKESAHKEALKYTGRKEFQTKNKAAYLAAFYHGWLDDITSHMDKKVRDKWSKEDIAKEAKKYQTFGEFYKKNQSAVNAAKRNGWWEEVTSHMLPVGNMFKRMVYVYEFPDNHVYVGLTMDTGARDKAHRTKERSAVFQHMNKTNLLPLFKVITDNFISATEAQNLERCTIDKYKSEGWNVINTAPGGGLGASCMKTWTIDSMRDISKKYRYRSDFCSENRSLCNAAKRLGIFDEITSHMISRHQTWDLDSIQKEANKYKTRNEFKLQSPNAYGAARNKNILDIVTRHMVSKEPMTIQKLELEAQKFDNLSDFKKQSPSYYHFASKNNLLPSITKHMKSKLESWNEDKIFQLADKYETIVDFRNNEPKAYGAAKRLNLVNKIRERKGFNPRK